MKQASLVSYCRAIFSIAIAFTTSIPVSIRGSFCVLPLMLTAGQSTIEQNRDVLEAKAMYYLQIQWFHYLTT